MSTTLPAPDKVRETPSPEVASEPAPERVRPLQKIIRGEESDSASDLIAQSLADILPGLIQKSELLDAPLEDWGRILEDGRKAKGESGQRPVRLILDAKSVDWSEVNDAIRALEELDFMEILMLVAPDYREEKNREKGVETEPEHKVVSDSGKEETSVDTTEVTESFPAADDVLESEISFQRMTVPARAEKRVIGDWNLFAILLVALIPSAITCGVTLLLTGEGKADSRLVDAPYAGELYPATRQAALTEAVPLEVVAARGDEDEVQDTVVEEIQLKPIPESEAAARPVEKRTETARKTGTSPMAMVPVVDERPDRHRPGTNSTPPTQVLDLPMNLVIRRPGQEMSTEKEEVPAAKAEPSEEKKIRTYY